LSDKSHPFYGGCPECGGKGVPVDLAEKVNICITWGELRLVVIWAERWADHITKSFPESKQVVYGIADALQLQHPDKRGLTFMSEISELRGRGLVVDQNVIGEES
jgi:hypothetical protein